MTERDDLIEAQARYLLAVCRAVNQGRQKYIVPGEKFDSVRDYWQKIAEHNVNYLKERSLIPDEVKP